MFRGRSNPIVLSWRIGLVEPILPALAGVRGISDGGYFLCPRNFSKLLEIAVTFSWALGAFTQCAEKHLFRAFAGEWAIRAHNSIADHDADGKRVGVKGA